MTVTIVVAVILLSITAYLITGLFIARYHALEIEEIAQEVRSNQTYRGEGLADEEYRRTIRFQYLMYTFFWIFAVISYRVKTLSRPIGKWLRGPVNRFNEEIKSAEEATAFWRDERIRLNQEMRDTYGPNSTTIRKEYLMAQELEKLNNEKAQELRARIGMKKEIPRRNG